MLTNKKIFNEKVKAKFLENYESMSQPAHEKIFLSSYQIEEALEKDLYNFNTEEIKEVLYNLNPPNLETSQSLGSIIKQYINWAIEKGYRDSNINPLENKRTSWFTQFAEKKKKHHITERELVAIEGLINNFQDAAMMRVIFEGAGGKDWAEIRNLKKDDINEKDNIVVLTDENGYRRKLKVSRRCIEMLIDAAQEKMYYLPDPEMTQSRISGADLEENDFVLRQVVTIEKNSLGPLDIETCFERLELVNGLLGTNLSFRALQEGGMLKVGKELYDANEKLTEVEYRKIADRFNIQSSFKSIADIVNLETFRNLDDI